MITRDRVLILAAESRPAMEEWIHSIRTASNASFYEVQKKYLKNFLLSLALLNLKKFFFVSRKTSINFLCRGLIN